MIPIIQPINTSVAGFSLSNYISAEEACDWTGKREAELRVAEKGNRGEKGEENGG